MSITVADCTGCCLRFVRGQPRLLLRGRKKRKRAGGWGNRWRETPPGTRNLQSISKTAGRNILSIKGLNKEFLPGRWKPSRTVLVLDQVAAWETVPDYKLAFGSPQGKQSLTWHGSTATILHSPGDEIWGVVWLMNSCDLNSLDKQEGVEGGLYAPIEINVNTQEGKTLRCRSYQMNDYVHNLPSPHYKKVICMGAMQNGLPTDYQKKLGTIETNNYMGNVPVFEEIEAAVSASEKTTY